MAAEGWLPFRTESPPSSKKAVRLKSELGVGGGNAGPRHGKSRLPNTKGPEAKAALGPFVFICRLAVRTGQHSAERANDPPAGRGHFLPRKGPNGKNPKIIPRHVKNECFGMESNSVKCNKIIV